MICEKCGKDLTDAVRLFGPAIVVFHDGLHARDDKRKRVADHIRKLRKKARAKR